MIYSSESTSVSTRTSPRSCQSPFNSLCQLHLQLRLDSIEPNDSVLNNQIFDPVVARIPVVFTTQAYHGDLASFTTIHRIENVLCQGQVQTVAILRFMVPQNLRTRPKLHHWQSHKTGFKNQYFVVHIYTKWQWWMGASFQAMTLVLLHQPRHATIENHTGVDLATIRKGPLRLRTSKTLKILHHSKIFYRWPSVAKPGWTRCPQSPHSF